MSDDNLKRLELQLLEMTKKIKEQERQIELANHDQLTGLRNRMGIAKEINEHLQEYHNGVFMILDMDHFKEVNDTYGHIEGDLTLVKFSKILRKCTSENDILARIGGDEFIIFLRDFNEKELIEKKATEIARRLEKELIDPGRLIRITISMGIALAPRDGMNFETLYSHGDTALYNAKHLGKNRFCFFGDVKETPALESRKANKASLTQIMESMREKDMEGTFLVEYDSFEKIYRFLERNLARENKKVQCVLLSMDDNVEDTVLQSQMESLKSIILAALRKGDVTTSYSRSQFLILLLDINKENAHAVVNRILDKYRMEEEEQALDIAFEVCELKDEQRACYEESCIEY